MSGWAAAGAAAGSLGGSRLGQIAQSKANKMNRDIAREQMRFQERMSSTAYQRAVKDMVKAGINPMMAYTQGGASAPAGAALPSMSEGGLDVGGAVNSAIAMKRFTQEMKNLKADEFAKTEAGYTSKALGAYYDAQTLGTVQDNRIKKLNADYEENLGNTAKYIRTILGPFAGASRIFMGGKGKK